MKIEDAIQNIRHAFESERLAQAYIVAGAPREEGRVLAEQVLGLVFCAERKKPCGNCRACAEVRGHTHPDILWVEPQKKSRKISIEQIRELQKQVFQTSFSGGWKACVLVGADRMGDQAANAFLKTLEEPPARCLFLLLTDSPQFLLPTVVSRCQTVSVATGNLSLSVERRKRVVEILGRRGVARPGKRSAIAAFGIGESLVGFLDEIEEAIEKEEAELAGEGGAGGDDETLDARISSRYREARSAIMHAILLWHRDILMLVCGMDRRLVFREDAFDCLKRQSNGLSFRAALRNLQTVEDMNRQLERSLPEKTVLDFGFSRLN